MAQPRNGKPLTVEQRQTLEAGHTFRRIVEPRLEPVRGKFDAAHLKEIKRRIFQDLPGPGFDDVTPGQYRPPVEAGNDWIKSRGLETVEASSPDGKSRTLGMATGRGHLVKPAGSSPPCRRLPRPPVPDAALLPASLQAEWFRPSIPAKRE